MIITKTGQLTKLGRDSPRQGADKSENLFEEILQKEIGKIKRKEKEQNDNTVRYPVGR